MVLVPPMKLAYLLSLPHSNQLWIEKLHAYKEDKYCTISIDSAWVVTCDAMDKILHMARLQRICDVEKNSAMSLLQACLKNLKLEQKCDLIFWWPKDPLNVPGQTICDMGQVMAESIEMVQYVRLLGRVLIPVAHSSCYQKSVFGNW